MNNFSYLFHRIKYIREKHRDLQFDLVHSSINLVVVFSLMDLDNQ
jgi:hypothetical protein